jgi:hypothetical protein
MKSGNYFHKSFAFLLVALLLVAFVSDGWGQNFTNNAGGVYNASCSGVIKVKSNPSPEANPFDGTLPLGVTASIPGAVDYEHLADGQVVYGIKYDHLVLSGGTKTVNDGVFITGIACPSPLTGYALLSTYPFYVTSSAVTYNGTFNYASTSGVQNIFPQYNSAAAEPTNYNILSLSGGGTSNIEASKSVGALDIVSDGTTSLTIEGNLWLGTGTSTLAGPVTLNDPLATLNMGSGPLTFDNTVTVTHGSIIADAGDGAVNIAATSALSLVNSDSKLNFASGTNLNITGTIANTGDGTNLLFDCASTVTYNGTQAPQIVLPTLASATHTYGNLTLIGGAKQSGTETYGNDITLCNNFSLTGGHLDMYTNTGTIHMNNIAGTVNYGVGGTGTEEVEGNFERTATTAASKLYFNNKFTYIDLAAAGTNPNSVTYNERPGVTPDDYISTTDVKRKITLTYTGESGQFTFGVGTGYLYTEGPNNGAWGGSATEGNLRFYEANSTQVEKIGTGFPYVKTAALSSPNMGSLELAGIIGNSTISTVLPNGIANFASTNDILLRTGPTIFYSIADGRWTNTATWDEGTLPTAIDNVEIRHVVYAGIKGPFIGTAGDPVNITSESSVYGAGAAANTIIIANDATNFPHASFVMGNEDNGDTYVFHTAGTSGVTFDNQNVATATNGIGTLNDASKSGAARTWFNGLWLSPLGNTPIKSTNLSTNKLQNEGAVNNEGTIEVGQ